MTPPARPSPPPPRKVRQLVDALAYVGDRLDWRDTKLRRVGTTIGLFGGWFCLMRHAGLL